MEKAMQTSQSSMMKKKGENENETKSRNKDGSNQDQTVEHYPDMQAKTADQAN